MGQFKDITIKEVIEEINVSYFLPDIQREYVWLDRAAEKKVEQLFDSILRNYPIGSFLFWRLRKTDVETDKSAQSDSDKLNFQLYQFIEDYDVRNPHNEKIDIAKVNSNDLNIVLDGQQRLTSLYIGLKGSRTLKKPKGWWDNPNAFELKKLYINLRYQPSEEDTEDCYQFEFKSPNQIPSPDEHNFWFKVGDILNLPSLNRYCRDNDLDDMEADILEKLKNVICNERLISYFEETEKNLDKVLKIFIRVNSGGTKLSYSDLLMSILTANFSSDIRGEMNVYVDKFRTSGFGCFGRDQILKTCLLLIGANHIFNLRNFNKTNIHSIEQNWTKIINSITDAVHIVEDFGYSGQLASGYIISIIALYLYRNDIEYSKLNTNDRDAMFKFVRTAQITSYFTTSLDRKLSYALDGMDNAKDFADFNARMAKMDANKALKVTTDDVADLLTLQYGNPAILPVLQILYPNLDYKNSTFHIDHIYPKAKFTTKNKALHPDFIEEKNYLFNLQLLEGAENISKKDTDPDVWMQEHFNNDASKIDDYKVRNYIDTTCSLKWSDFKTFKEKRSAAIRSELIAAFK
ncbi:MAG: DUF262 domain-containing protein [Bacteroidales bacterium]|nr:DUF262 domain-containing protein [Bacteroidales bacterium]